MTAVPKVSAAGHRPASGGGMVAASNIPLASSPGVGCVDAATNNFYSRFRPFEGWWNFRIDAYGDATVFTLKLMGYSSLRYLMVSGNHVVSELREGCAILKEIAAARVEPTMGPKHRG